MGATDRDTLLLRTIGGMPVMLTAGVHDEITLAMVSGNDMAPVERAFDLMKSQIIAALRREGGAGPMVLQVALRWDPAYAKPATPE